MSFRIQALPMSLFSPLLVFADEELRERGVLRRIVDKKPGFPCRVSLADAEVGETVLLVNYEHQPARTPFRSSHAIYVRVDAVEAKCATGEVPELLRSRLISLRGFDDSGMLINADVTEGRTLEPAIERLFANAKIDYIHLHYAKPGCYAARVERSA
jgi:hypothetical protein